jgi:coiled-coil domain-containing protein 12
MTDRKARLAALAAKAGRSKQQPPVSGVTDGDGDIIVPSVSKQVVFRNYAPQDVALEHDADEEEPDSKRTKVNVKSALEAALEETALETTTTATSLAPKKVNWDLKRDIQEKMDKLERKTHRAIVQLLRERLEREAEEEVEDIPDLD